MSSFHASAKVLNFIDTRPKDNEVKGAVQLDPKIQRFLSDKCEANSSGSKSANLQASAEKVIPCSTFAIFDKQGDNLLDFINRLSNQLGQLQTKDTCGYGLMFDDGRRFVTDENKHLIQQGFLLILTASPANYARTLLLELKNIDLTKDCTSELTSLALFVSLAADSSFANALKNIGGVKELISVIESGIFETNVAILCQVLQTFLVLMSHPEIVYWEDITRKFFEKIVVYVNGSSKMENNDSLYLSLSIILNVMSRCNELEEILKNEIKFETLIRHLENSDERILLNALLLMNMIYQKSNNEEKQSIVKILHGKPFVAAIETGIVRESRSPNQQICAQLVEIQNILVEELRNLALRLPTEQEIDYIMAMEEWSLSNAISNSKMFQREMSTNCEAENEFSVFYDDDVRNGKRQIDIENFKALVQKSPPGSLALCAILEFTRPENLPTNSRFREIQMESLIKSSVWPIIMASLANSLILSLGIYDDKRQNCKEFSQLILKSERPFYDIFGIMIELFHRTWREMHANVDDLDKVISVVHDQMKRALALNPGSLDDLDKFTQRNFSYFNMQKIWEQERIEQEELELNSVGIQLLRDHLRSSLEQLVINRKKSFLKNGLVFAKLLVNKSHVKDQQQYWFWKLDENERYFCYSDCKLSQNRQMELDSSSMKKISIFNIQKITHGSEYSNQLSQQFGVKLSKKNQPTSLQFRCGLSIELCGDSMSGCELMHLSTTNEKDLNRWIDGMNCLISPQIALQSPAIKEEVEQLLNLEVRVRLLDVENIRAASDIVPPELPTDLSWVPCNNRK